MRSAFDAAVLSLPSTPQILQITVLNAVSICGTMKLHTLLGCKGWESAGAVMMMEDKEKRQEAHIVILIIPLMFKCCTLATYYISLHLPEGTSSKVHGEDMRSLCLCSEPCCCCDSDRSFSAPLTTLCRAIRLMLYNAELK